MEIGPNLLEAITSLGVVALGVVMLYLMLR